jgi:adenosine deaminase
MRDLAALPKAHVHLHLDGSMRRNRPPHEATALARLAVARRDDGVVGFGLDGDETTAPGTSFAQAYSVAREGGLLAVPHAGELSPAGSVRDAVDVLGADRVMHGVTAVDDPDLLDHLVVRDVALDVCPTSNVLLSGSAT